MIAPEGQLGAYYYGEVVSSDEKNLTVKWEHSGSQQTLPRSYFIPADQPHEQEYKWLAERLYRLQGEMDHVRSKMMKACNHKSITYHDYYKDRPVERCYACGSITKFIKEKK